MNIGIIGAGNVGGALGRRWARAGHDVAFGIRNPQDPEVADLVKEAGKHAHATNIKDAAQSAEVVVLAVPWTAAHDALKDAGSLSGKILLDCMNPLKPDLSGLEMGHTTSAAEQVASWAPQARVVKIFNTTGFKNMENPRYPEGPVTMFYCGDDAPAKRTAHLLASDLGFDPIDAGALTIARLLEPYAMLWIHLAHGQKLGMNIAFRLMRR
jgi:8-hydroxy-5-deazaflavin:NADPH oxidoreductase